MLDLFLAIWNYDRTLEAETSAIKMDSYLIEDYPISFPVVNLRIFHFS